MISCYTPTDSIMFRLCWYLTVCEANKQKGKTAFKWERRLDRNTDICFVFVCVSEKEGVCVCVWLCVCLRKRERKTVNVCVFVCDCDCMCVSWQERERGRKNKTESLKIGWCDSLRVGEAKSDVEWYETEWKGMFFHYETHFCCLSLSLSLKHVHTFTHILAHVSLFYTHTHTHMFNKTLLNLICVYILKMYVQNSLLEAGYVRLKVQSLFDSDSNSAIVDLLILRYSVVHKWRLPLKPYS